MNNTNMQDIQHCAELIHKAKRIVALTGAGISTKAGIPDFRGPKGLYVTKQYDADTIFDIEYFSQDPRPFFEFARDFTKLEETLQPTFAHQFFASLEKQGRLKGIITQNIDNLHQRAGSKNVIELHGSFLRSFCMECQKEYSYEAAKEKLSQQEVPQCSCGGVIKPDIVFFGENVKHLPEAHALARQADLFFVVGTSCMVYPAAAIPEHVQGKIVVINEAEVRLLSWNIALSVQSDIDEFLAKVAEILA